MAGAVAAIYINLPTFVDMTYRKRKKLHFSFITLVNGNAVISSEAILKENSLPWLNLQNININNVGFCLLRPRQKGASYWKNYCNHIENIRVTVMLLINVA